MKTGKPGMLDTMKALAGVRTDTELAGFLGVSKQTIASWRQRGAVPMKACVDFANKAEVTLDSLLEPPEGARVILAADERTLALVVYFYDTRMGDVKFGDRWQTSLFWGRALPRLIEYFGARLKKSGPGPKGAARVREEIEKMNPSTSLALLNGRDVETGELLVVKDGALVPKRSAVRVAQ